MNKIDPSEEKKPSNSKETKNDNAESRTQAVLPSEMADFPRENSHDKENSLSSATGDPSLSLEIMQIADWCPVFFFVDGDCCVAGYILLEGVMRLYRTNIITSVEDGGRVLLDKSEKRSRLMGDWCKTTYDEIAKFENLNAVNEFPESFTAAFKNGFPQNWREIIKATVTILSRKGTGVKEHSARNSETELSLTSPPSPVPLNSSFFTDEADNFRIGTAGGNFTFKIVKDNCTRPHMVSNDVKELHIDRLDSGGPFELISNLKRTRSGRLVRPPLDTWRGQYMNVDGNSISVCPGAETDPIYLKWLGLKPRPQEDSGYLSPPRKVPRGRRKAPRTASVPKRKRKTTALPISFSDSDTSASYSPLSLRQRLLQRATEKRTHRTICGCDKGVQVSLPLQWPSVNPEESLERESRHTGTQTTEADSGIVPGISPCQKRSVRGRAPGHRQKVSVSSPCAVGAPDDERQMMSFAAYERALMEITQYLDPILSGGPGYAPSGQDVASAVPFALSSTPAGSENRNRQRSRLRQKVLAFRRATQKVDLDATSGDSA